MACVNACSSYFTWQYRVVKSVAGDLRERARTCVDLRVRLTLFVTDRGYISSRGDAPRSSMPKMLEGTQSFGAQGRNASTTSQPQHAQCHTQRWQRRDIIQPQPPAFRDHASAYGSKPTLTSWCGARAGGVALLPSPDKKSKRSN